MPAIRTLSARLFLAVMLLFPAMPTQAQGPDLTTPEGAVAAYIGGLAHQNFDEVLAATYTEKASKAFAFDTYVGRSQKLIKSMPLPSSSPLFAGINRASFADGFVMPLKLTAYALLAPGDGADGEITRLSKDDAKALEASLRPERLAGLNLVKIGIPRPAIVNNKFNLANWNVLASTFGANAYTERLALIEFEDATFALGFGLMQYGDRWFVANQSTMVTDDEHFVVPKPMTPDAFEEWLK